MAISQVACSEPTKSGKDFKTECGILTWTSTTATVEITTGLTRVYGASFTRIGSVDDDDMGVLSIDESVTARTGGNYIAVTGGAFTVDRGAATAGGTLTGESHFYTLIGN